MSRNFVDIHQQLYMKLMNEFSVEASPLPSHPEGEVDRNVNYVYMSEPEQQYGKFDKPSIGIFLGVVKNNPEVRQFHPMEHTYILTALKTFDIDVYSSYGSAMADMYGLILDVIDFIGYEVVVPIETLTSISNEEGLFTVGYIAQIAIDAKITKI